MQILVQGDDIRTEIKVKAHHGQLRPAQESMGNINNYYMGLSHKDWKLPNSRTWLAEIDIESSLDFPISTGITQTADVLQWKSCEL